MSFSDGIAAAQILGNGAMNYAAQAIIMPTEHSPLAALEDARQIVAADSAPLVSSVMADALKDLQMAAVIFTVQAAISNYRGDLADFDRLGEQLSAVLEHRGAVRMSLVHDVVITAQALGARALDYAREIVAAEDSATPVGSDTVQRAVANLQVAAIAFVVCLAISEGHERRRMRRIEKKLVALFAHQGAS